MGRSYMSDNHNHQASCKSLDSYNVITDRSVYEEPKDRRDRLNDEQGWCPDEPSQPVFLDFQRILDQAYTFKKDGRLDQVYMLLTNPTNRRLPVSYYQIARAEYLLGECLRTQDALGDVPKRRAEEISPDPDVTGLEGQQPLLARVADHFCRGAAAAQQLPDWALYAQLKHLESAACMSVDPKQLRRAFEAAVAALKAWRRLPIRYLACDDHFEFRLAEAVGLRAQIVAEFDIATDALERAAVLLQRLLQDPDADGERLANDDTWLDWDWAVLDLAKGNPKVALGRVLRTRRKGGLLFNPSDRVRLARLIAVIALDCVEIGGVESYSRKRLLNVADAEICEAYRFLESCDDEQVHAMVLLADARLLGLFKVDEDRVGKIEEARQIAEKLSDAALGAQVDVAWGDEYRLQGKKRRARECYQKAMDDMTKMDFLELARIAQQRLDRLK